MLWSPRRVPDGHGCGALAALAVVLGSLWLFRGT